MKKKITIAIIVLLVIVALGVTYYLTRDKYAGTYEIQVELVDDRSPDRVLVVLKNGKKTNDYKHIEYEDGVILCYQKNPTVNMHEIEEKLIIVLPDDRKVTAKVLKEAK